MHWSDFTTLRLCAMCRLALVKKNFFLKEKDGEILSFKQNQLISGYCNVNVLLMFSFDELATYHYDLSKTWGHLESQRDRGIYNLWLKISGESWEKIMINNVFF